MSTTRENSGKNSGPIRDGKGRIHGGNPGNSGGKKGRSGRPPSWVRQKCLGSFQRRIKVLEQIADDATAPVTDRLRAVDLLGKYAGLQKVEHTGSDSTPMQFTFAIEHARDDETEVV